MSDFAQFADLVVSLQAKDGEKVVGTFKTVVKEGEKVTTTFYKVGAEAEKAGKGAKKLNDELTASSGRLKVIGRDINRYVTLPFIAFTAASTKFALDLNKGMAAVDSNLIGSLDRIYELRDGIVDLAQTSGRSFDDLTQGLYEYTSVFEDTEDTMKNITIATKTATAGYASTEEAVRLLAAVTRAYGDASAEAMQRVADLSFETVRLGAVTIPELSAAMQVATDRADRLNVSQEELFTVFATLTGITGDASMVATQFRSAMDSLLNPTKELTELLEQMGYDSAEAALAEKGLLGVMVAINNAAIASGKPLQDYITRKEGMTLVSRLATSQLDDFAIKLGQVSNRTGALETAYDRVTENIGKFNHQLDVNKMRIQSSFAEIGQTLLPLLVGLTDVVASIISGFANMPSVIQNLIGLFITLVSVSGGLLQIWGAIKSLEIAKVFTSAGVALNKVIIMGTSLTTILGPIGVLLGAIVAASIAIGISSANAQRAYSDSITATNERLQEQVNLLTQAKSLGQRIETTSDAVVAALASQYQTSGQIPTFREVRATELGNRGGLAQSGTRSLDVLGDKAERDRLISQLQTFIGEYDTLLSDLNTLQEQKVSEAEEASANYNRVYESTIRKLSDFLTDTLTASDASAQNFLAEFNNILNSPSGTSAIIRNLDSFRSKMDRYLTLPRTDEEQAAWDSLSLSLTQLNTALLSFKGSETSLEALNEQMSNLGFNETEINKAKALLQVIFEYQAGLQETAEKSPVYWQKIFADITDVFDGIVAISEKDGKEVVTPLINSVGRAVEIYGDALNESIEQEIRISDLLGEGLLNSEIIGQVREQVSEHFRELVKAGRIELTEESLQAISDITSAFDIRKIVAEGQEQAQSWDDQQQALDFYNNTLDEYGLKLEKATLDQSYWEDELKKSIDILFAIEQKLGRNSDEFLKQSENVQRAHDELMKFNEEGGKTLTIFKGFEEVMDGLFDLDTAVQNSLFDFFSTDRADEIKKEIRDLEVFGGESTKAVKGQIADLTEELFKLQGVGAVVADIFGNVLGLAMQGLIDSFYDLGKAIAAGGDGWDSFKNSLEATLITIAKAIPDLLIAGGIQLLGVNPAVGIALILAGLAGKAFVGYAEGLAAEKDIYGPASGTITPMSDGGLINHSMQYGRNIIGEAGPELLFPATRTTDGQLAVRAVGAGSGGVEINVFNNASDQVQTRQQEEPDGSITLIIEKVVQGIATSGGLNRALQTQFVGLRTRGEN